MTDDQGRENHPEPKDTGPSSVVDELRAAFAQELKEPRLYKTLPARGQGLVAEYRLLSVDEAEKAFDKEKSVEQAQDVLIRALVQLHLHRPDDERADTRGLVPLHIAVDEADLGPLRFDERLCGVLGISKGTARQIALQMFDGNEIALAGQAQQLGVWSDDTSLEYLQDFTEGS